MSKYYHAYVMDSSTNSKKSLPKNQQKWQEISHFFLISSIFEKIKEMGIQEHILKNTFKIEI